MPDMVNHPSHYNSGKFETIDVIEDWRLGFNLGNAVKYISRCEHKHSKLEDLRKAAWYLEREIKNLENSACTDDFNPERHGWKSAQVYTPIRVDSELAKITVADGGELG